jgi:hypothetical protein
MTPVSFDSLCGEAVDFGGHDEVAFGETVDLVRPESDFGFAPGEEDVGMMSLLFGERTDTVDEVERLLEVGELELAVKMMLVGDGPFRDARVNLLDVLAFEWGNATFAGDAGLVSKLLSHDLNSIEIEPV